MRLPIPRAVAAVALLATACVHRSPTTDALPEQEYRGYFTSGPGASWFRPCGAAPADSAWWVTVTGAAVEQVAGARAAGRLVDGRASYVRWRAAYTTSGQIGPRGRGAPALLVREVIALRPSAPADCPAPLP